MNYNCEDLQFHECTPEKKGPNGQSCMLFVPAPGTYPDLMEQLDALVCAEEIVVTGYACENVWLTNDHCECECSNGAFHEDHETGCGHCDDGPSDCYGCCSSWCEKKNPGPRWGGRTGGGTGRVTGVGGGGQRVVRPTGRIKRHKAKIMRNNRRRR